MTKRNAIVFILVLVLAILAVVHAHNSETGQYNLGPLSDLGSLSNWFLVFIPAPMLALLSFQRLASYSKKAIWGILLQVLVGVYIVCFPLLPLLALLALPFVGIAAIVLIRNKKSDIERKAVLTYGWLGFILLLVPIFVGISILLNAVSQFENNFGKF